MLKKVVPAALLLGLVSSASAQIPQDVGAEIASELTKYKVKKGAAQAQFTAIGTFFAPTMDPSKIRKAKATGTITFLISSDRKPSSDDTVISAKKINWKAFVPKFIKVKANLSASDKGRYILAVVDSPQDQYMANNVSSYHIPFNAF